jgi:predicted nucleic acid-binding protein
MSIAYTIKAEVVDIRCDKPLPRDVFVVDTNALLWCFYANAGSSNYIRQYQLDQYPKYLLSASSLSLSYVGLSLSEISHLIENIEYELYVKRKNIDRDNFRKKEYRHSYPEERKKVVREITAAWNAIKSFASLLEINVDEDTTNNALSRLSTEALDGYDLFMLEAMKKEGIYQIITDDGDFVNVPGITLFTANQNVIREAERQGKLLTR